MTVRFDAEEPGADVRGVDGALDSIREVVARQLGVGRPEAVAVEPESLVRFSSTLPAELTAEVRADLESRSRALDPWLQGPFLLGGNLVVGGAWRTDHRWLGLGREMPASLAGKRVLDVGSNAGYDAFMFNLLGADYVMACEPFAFHNQAIFLESIYQSGVNFQNIGWQQLDPQVHGQFDVIHCNGVLYHEPNPLQTLSRLREMLAPGGEIFLGSIMLADPELSEFARFVPGTYFGDPSWWWVPGRLCVRWMMEAAGFMLGYEFGTHDGPPGEFATQNGYFRAGEGQPDAGLGL
jgi:2-polyprenyl-3-methyl-5-hydroxy-6-metoxy-1,4-benzoquinol methylase